MRAFIGRMVALLLIVGLWTPVDGVANPKKLDSVFDSIISKSNNYQDYKVIKKKDLAFFKQQYGEFFSVQQKEVEKVASLKSRVSELEAELQERSAQMNKLRAEVDGISIFGIQAKKGSVSAVFWTIMLVFILIVAILFFKMYSSTKDTTRMRIEVQTREEELQSHRRWSLSREQQLTNEIMQLKRELNDRDKG